MKKKVLIMTAYYTPAVKGGGPIQSIKNLVDNLSDKIDFYIITSDRDVNDDKPFPNITTDHWTEVGKAKVFYTDASKLTFKKMKRILNRIDYNVIYLNSFFSFKFSIMPILLWKLNKIPQKSIVIAPRGEFSEGALRLKKGKKKLYIKLVRVLGLYKKVKWHATTDKDKDEIKQIFEDARINIANNLTFNYKKLQYDKTLKKKKGEIKILYLSRVHPTKNLKKAIEFLKKVEGKIQFNIFGPIEDKKYWAECERLIEQLPNTVRVDYKDVVSHNDVLSIFKDHHIFLLPTLGENFGHVISEALMGGCPVIISDQTPWKNLLEKGCGWDVNLNNESEFVRALQYCVNMEQNEYNSFSKSAFEYGEYVVNDAKSINDSLSLFE